jgi:hypothetical protein
MLSHTAAGGTTRINGGGGAMARRDEQESTLSVHRAFVVHFGTRGQTGLRRFSGRVEHLSSGESIHFSSLKGLLAFFAAVIDTGTTFRGTSSVLPRLDAAQASCRHSPSALHQHQKEHRP